MIKKIIIVKCLLVLILIVWSCASTQKGKPQVIGQTNQKLPPNVIIDSHKIDKMVSISSFQQEKVVKHQVSADLRFNKKFVGGISLMVSTTGKLVDGTSKHVNIRFDLEDIIEGQRIPFTHNFGKEFISIQGVQIPKVTELIKSYIPAEEYAQFIKTGNFQELDKKEKIADQEFKQKGSILEPGNITVENFSSQKIAYNLAAFDLVTQKDFTSDTVLTFTLYNQKGGIVYLSVWQKFGGLKPGQTEKIVINDLNEGGNTQLKDATVVKLTKIEL